MSAETVLLKIRKLLALSRDKATSVHEAAAAAAMAQRLMARYAIDSQLVDADGCQEPEHFDRTKVYGGRGAMPTWILTICGAVTKASDLSGSFESDRDSHGWTIYGPRDPALSAGELIEWLVSEVQRLELEARTPVARLTQTLLSGKAPSGRAHWTAFRNGAAATIAERLAEARLQEREAARREAGGDAPTAHEYEAAAEAAAAGDPSALLELDGRSARAAAPGRTNALAKVDAAIALLDSRHERIRAWLDKTGTSKGFSAVRRRYRVNEGYEAGREAGHRATLRAGKRLPGGA